MRQTRILVLSDTHSSLPSLGTLPQADVAIHCGDLTSTGKPEEHSRAIELLASLPAPLKIVIPGNHDLTLDRAYCETHSRLYGWRRNHTPEDLAASESCYTNERSQELGIFYLVEGVRTFNLRNGANLAIYASAWTPEFCDWAFAYPRETDRFNAANENGSQEPVPEFKDFNESSESDPSVSIMITHGPPKGILDKTIRGENVGCDSLFRAVHRCKPMLHCFGHIHEGWGISTKHWRQDPTSVLDSSRLTPSGRFEDSYAHVDATSVLHGQETVFINASIMDIRYVPCQKPWVVDLLLPTARA